MKKTVLFFLIFILSITFCGCQNGVMVWVDDTYMQTNSVNVKVDSVGKKVFILGVDSNERVGKFGEFGELPLITIQVYGNTTQNILKTTTNPMTISNQVPKVATGNDEIIYYADYFKIKLRMPEGTTMYNKLDGRGLVEIDTAKQKQDNYFYEKVEWVRGDNTKNNYTVVQDDNSGDNYLYYGFATSKGVYLAQYFVRVIYNVQID